MLLYSLPAAMDLPTDFSVWKTLVLPVVMWVLSGFSCILPQSRHACGGLLTRWALIVGTNTRPKFVGFSGAEDVIMDRGARNSF